MIDELPRLTATVSAPAPARRPEHIDADLFIPALIAVFVFVVVPVLWFTFRPERAAIAPVQPTPEQPLDQDWAHHPAATR